MNFSDPALNYHHGLNLENGHVIYEGASSQKTLLIVFAYINQPVGTRSHSSFLRDVDCKKLFINPGENAWYQTGVPGIGSSYAEVAAHLVQVKAAHPDHQILCLGHSMGGFAALGLGLHVSADRILASVPEYALNLPGSVSLRYMKDTCIQCGDLSEALSHNVKSRLTILVGSKNPFDLSMANGIATLTSAEVLTINCGHETFPYLRDNEKLGPLLSGFVEDKPLQPILAGL